MEGISDLRIIGIDERRPPIIRKAPYIDIFFKLSHKAPVDWCNALNSLLKKQPTAPKIKKDEGLYIEAWVRTPDEIVDFLSMLKARIAECNKHYIEQIELAASNAGNAKNSLAKEDGEQGRLNSIIAALDFDEIKI